MQIVLKLLGRQAVSALLLVVAVIFAVVPAFHNHAPKFAARADFSVAAASGATFLAVRQPVPVYLDAAETAERPCDLCRWANQTPGRAEAVSAVCPLAFRLTDPPARESPAGRKHRASDQPRAPPHQA